jgi:hypothetical protein
MKIPVFYDIVPAIGNAPRGDRHCIRAVLPAAITSVWTLFSFGGCLILMGYANPEFRN